MTAVINGFLAPPLLISILKISNDRKIMGDRVNGAFLNTLGWFTFAAMSAAAVALIATWGTRVDCVGCW
jgi:Mn2+/Fe2+ NRAMP family transporter